MQREKVFEVLNELVKLDEDEIKLVLALAEFQKYLQANIGEKIDLTTVSVFAKLVGQIADALED